MQTAQGQLTILNAHTPEPTVFWNGNQVTGITYLKVDDGRVATQ